MKKNAKTKKHIEVANPFIGICHMAVCCTKDHKPSEILEFCNSENPAGTTGGWSKVYWHRSKKNQKPVQCSDHPDRIHVLIGC